MAKIMLVLDNPIDQKFLEKVLQRLKYTVISMSKGENLSEQLIDHFPDIVFASTLGKNQKILSALAKIKAARGKPKLVFVRQEKESTALNDEQKRVIDGVLYSPVDPFKLIDLLSNITGEDIVDLRRRYNLTLRPEKEAGEKQIDPSQLKVAQEPDYGETRVFGDSSKSPDKIEVKGSEKDFGHTTVYGKKSASEITHVKGSTSEGGHRHIKSDDPSAGRGSVHTEEDDTYSDATVSRAADVEGEASHQEAVSDTGRTTSVDSGSERFESPDEKPIDSPISSGSAPSDLINDSSRRDKYNKICNDLAAKGEAPPIFDVKKLRKLQKVQSEEISESADVKANRKHFLKTLFSMDPKDISKKRSS